MMLLLLIPACMMTGSVETEKPRPPVATFCSTYNPVRWSRLDTVDTVVQTKGNNAAYKRLCQKQ